MTFKTPPSRRSLGLPKNGSLERVAYSSESGVLIALMSVPMPLVRVHRLFVRHESNSRYAPVIPKTKTSSTYSLVVGNDSRAFFLSTHFYRTSSGVGGDEAEVGVLQLGPRSVEYLRPLDSKGQPVSLVSLCGVAKNGRDLIASAGFTQGPDSNIVFQLSRVSLRTSIATPFAPMSGVFV